MGTKKKNSWSSLSFRSVDMDFNIDVSYICGLFRWNSDVQVGMFVKNIYKTEANV